MRVSNIISSNLAKYQFLDIKLLDSFEVMRESNGGETILY